MAAEKASTPLLSEGIKESERFGFRIFRGSVETLHERTLLEELLAKNVDVAIVRLLKNGHEQLHKLQRLGLPYIVADTLVSYACDLTKLQPAPLRNQDLEFIECNASHAEAVDRLVELSFGDYRNHYSANPVLDASGLLEGYKEWTRGYTEAKDPAKRTWLVRSGGEDVAFATVGLGEVSEGVLYGVHPNHSGRGIYGDIIRFTQNVTRERGAHTMRVSTQVSNFAVQKVWTRSGFSLVDAYLTVHINALLNAKGVHHAVQPVRFDAKDVERFAELSGDGNPVHLDAEAARKAGFEGQIVHGARVISEMSRFFAMEFPGPGSILTGQRFKFLKPVYAGRDYTLDYRFPVHDPARGAYLAVATVRDATGAALLVSHTELVKR